MTNKIRSTDNKGRITVGEKGILYCVHENEDGTILLDPLKIPTPPKMEREDMRAIYVKPGMTGHTPDTVTVYSTWGNLQSLALGVAELAERLSVPVVIDPSGVGSAVSDLIKTSGVEVIEKYF